MIWFTSEARQLFAYIKRHDVNYSSRNKFMYCIPLKVYEKTFTILREKQQIGRNICWIQVTAHKVCQINKSCKYYNFCNDRCEFKIFLSNLKNECANRTLKFVTQMQLFFLQNMHFYMYFQIYAIFFWIYRVFQFGFIKFKVS